MYSINSVFHHFEKSIPVHLQHTFEEGGTHCAYALTSCTQPQGRNSAHPAAARSSCCTSSTAGELRYTKREGATITTDTSVASSSPSGIMGEPRQLTPINHFLEDTGRGRDLGHL